MYVNQDKNGFSEYVFCSHGPVESWSFGMKESYNEMTREFNYIKTVGPKNADGFLNPNTVKYGCAECFQGYTIHDARNDGSEITIKNSMNYMLRTVAQQKGKVYDLRSYWVYKRGDKVNEHFKTHLKLPFHK